LEADMPLQDQAHSLKNLEADMLLQDQAHSLMNLEAVMHGRDKFISYYYIGNL
jgi:hypothetical protein